jgi:cyanophycin synthetase
MEYDSEIDLSKRKYTSRLVVERCISRGWKIVGFKTNPAIFLIYVPGRDKPIKVFSASPPQMSYPASKVAKDKFITNRILEMEGLPVPNDLLVDGQNADPSELKKFLEINKKVVVKPLDASHGKGITVDVTTPERLKSALSEAHAEAHGDTVLIQQQIAGVDIRVVCIDYKFVDSISRIPASVVGDGTHTVAELIKLENQSEERGQNYTSKLNVIPADKAEAYLGAEAMQSLPPEGEHFQVIGVSNVGQGGIRYNIKHDIPDFLKVIAIKAAKELELPVCGVDFMVTRLPKSSDTIEDLNPHIIEANECPMLTMYDDLHSEEQNQVIDTYLDYLATA